jgi:hypothetical protein
MPNPERLRAIVLGRIGRLRGNPAVRSQAIVDAPSKYRIGGAPRKPDTSRHAATPQREKEFPENGHEPAGLWFRGARTMSLGSGACELTAPHGAGLPGKAEALVGRDETDETMER